MDTKTNKQKAGVLIRLLAASAVFLILLSISFLGTYGTIGKDWTMALSCVVAYFVIARITVHKVRILSNNTLEDLVFNPLIFGVFGAMIYWFTLVSPVR